MYSCLSKLYYIRKNANVYPTGGMNWTPITIAIIRTRLAASHPQKAPFHPADENQDDNNAIIVAFPVVLPLFESKSDAPSFVSLVDDF